MENEHMVNKNGEVREGKVEQTLDRISNERADDILRDFNDFKNYLKERIELGKKLGLTEEQLATTAEKVAGYLSDHVEPKNREEKLLKELWKVGNDEERHKLAHLLVRFASQE